MGQNPFSVISFNQTIFHTLFSHNENTSIHSSKIQILYLFKYLEHLKAKTIVIENNYIDRSYLEDYSSYYSRCFNQYTKTCKRLHFFKDYKLLDGFVEEEFNLWLSGNEQIVSNERLKNNYLGFIVIRPLPETVIGRTCLITPAQQTEKRKRFFPTTQNYEAGLCGLTLTIKNSLPFQEQDKVTAACATSALWSLFHSTSTNSRQIKSPSTITQIASRGNYSELSELPTPGLTPEMMSSALASEGLEPHVISLKWNDHQDETKTSIYPYLKNGIPILLAADAYVMEDKYRHKGRHAITICGYSLKNEIDLSGRTPEEFVLFSEFIDRLYAHDDQIGPFASLDISETPVKATSSKNGNDQEINLSTYFSCEIPGKSHPHIYSPCNIIMGLYHKIRIPFSIIEDCSAKFSDFIFEYSRDESDLINLIYPDSRPLLWNIYLTSPTIFKEEIHNDVDVSEEIKLKVAKLDLPKYIWRAEVKNKKGHLFDLLFDATDIPQGTIFIDIIERNKGFQSFINFILNSEDNIPEEVKNNKYGIFYKMLATLCSRFGDSNPELSDLYGFPRLPLALKSPELNNRNEAFEHPDLIKINEREPNLNLEYERYIWAISFNGEICLANDRVKDFGHPTLVKGGYARICGELISKDDGYILNNMSGRYSKHYPSGNGDFLKNAKVLFEKHIPKLKILSCVESSRHGALSITDPERFQDLFKEASANSSDENTKVLSILKEIGRLTPELK